MYDQGIDYRRPPLSGDIRYLLKANDAATAQMQSKSLLGKHCFRKYVANTKYYRHRRNR